MNCVRKPANQLDKLFLELIVVQGRCKCIWHRVNCKCKRKYARMLYILLMSDLIYLYFYISFKFCVSKVCLSAQSSVIIGMMPAKLIRSVWRMFLKTITSLFIKKISVLQTSHAKLMKQCMAMEKTFVRRCGQVPIITPRQMLIILTV